MSSPKRGTTLLSQTRLSATSHRRCHSRFLRQPSHTLTPAAPSLLAITLSHTVVVYLQTEKKKAKIAREMWRHVWQKMEYKHGLAPRHAEGVYAIRHVVKHGRYASTIHMYTHTSTHVCVCIHMFDIHVLLLYSRDRRRVMSTCRAGSTSSRSKSPRPCRLSVSPSSSETSA